MGDGFLSHPDGGSMRTAEVEFYAEVGVIPMIPDPADRGEHPTAVFAFGTHGRDGKIKEMPDVMVACCARCFYEILKELLDE